MTTPDMQADLVSLHTEANRLKVEIAKAQAEAQQLRAEARQLREEINSHSRWRYVLPIALVLAVMAATVAVVALLKK